MYGDKEKLFVYNQLKLLLSENKVISYELDRFFGRSNLAYFIDSNINNDNWDDLLGIIKGLALSVNTVNELYYLIASTNIQSWSKDVSKNKSSEEAKHLAKIGECILAPYTDKFKQGTLKDFAVVRTCPLWFIDYEIQNISNKHDSNTDSKPDVESHNPKVDVFNDLMSMFETNASFTFIPNNKDNAGNIAYLIDHYYGSEEWGSLYDNICYLTQISSVNDLCLAICTALSIALIKDVSAVESGKTLDDIYDKILKCSERFAEEYEDGTLDYVTIVGNYWYPEWYTNLCK